MQQRWTAVRRAVGLLPLVGVVFTGNWIAVAVASLALVLSVGGPLLAVGWLARRTDAERIQTPILIWTRRPSFRRPSRRRGAGGDHEGDGLQAGVTYSETIGTKVRAHDSAKENPITVAPRSCATCAGGYLHSGSRALHGWRMSAVRFRRRNRTADPILTMEPPGTAVRTAVTAGGAQP